MKSFEEVYQIVEESSHETAFNKGEAEALYQLVMDLPEGSHVVEIGVEYGRSTSVIAEIAKEHKLYFVAIDNFSQGNGEEASRHILDKIKKYGWTVDLVFADSVLTSILNPYMQIDLLHIDGAHEYESVLEDCKAWLPKVKKNGFALFDDYTHPGLEGVEKAVTEYMESTKETWKLVGVFGNKLGVFQRV